MHINSSTRSVGELCIINKSLDALLFKNHGLCKYCMYIQVYAVVTKSLKDCKYQD